MAALRSLDDEPTPVPRLIPCSHRCQFCGYSREFCACEEESVSYSAEVSDDTGWNV